MASALYDKARDDFANGLLDWTDDDHRVYLIDTADYTFSAAHEDLADVAAGAKVAYSLMAGESSSAGVCDANDTTLSSVTGDPCEALIIAKWSGVESTSRVIAYIDGISVTPNGGDITISWDDGANKIFKL